MTLGSITLPTDKMPYLDEQLAEVLGQEFMLADAVTVRMMTRGDLPDLRRLSPRERKNPLEFFIYPTLVAEVDGEIAGYTQFALGPDGVLHSLAIRIGADYKGMGIGQRLMDTKEALAKAAGAKIHLYAIAKDGEEALKKIVTKQGMHLCQRHGDLLLYAKQLGLPDDRPHAEVPSESLWRPDR